MKLIIEPGTTDYTVVVFIQDSSSATGEGLTGLDDTKVDGYYCVVETDNDITKGDLGINDLAAITDAHADGGFIEIDSANLPGWYRVDLPDALLAAGIWAAGVRLYDAGSNNVADCNLEIQISHTVAEPTAVPAATATLADKIAWLAALARNKVTQTSTTQTLRNDADGANIATSTISDVAGTYTRGEWT